MNILDLFRGGAKLAAKPGPKKPVAGNGVLLDLFSPQAIDKMAEMMGSLPDPDEVLSLAGLTRKDLRKLLGDDEVEAALETRVSAMLSVPWRLEPGEGEQTEFLWAELERVFEPLATSLWQAVPFGYSVVELTYREPDPAEVDPLRRGRTTWGSVDERPFEWFVPKSDGSLRYFPSDGSGGTDGIEVDTTAKFLLSRRKPTYRNPYGEAVLSRLYWPWFFRSNGWRFWARFLERFGAPLLLGKTSADPAAMAEALSKALQSAVAAVGGDDEVQAISPTNAGDAFDRFSVAVDKRIQKVVLGQTLTTDTQGTGSQALGRVHAEVKNDRKLSDVKLVRAGVQKAINALSRLNFPGAEPPVFVMSDGKGLDPERAERDAKLTQAGIIKPTEQYLLDRYDFEAGDFTIPAAAPTAVSSSQPKPGTPAAKAALLSARFFDMGRTPRAKRATRFTAQQEEVEDLADAALDALGGRSPIDPKLVRSAVLAAKDPEDLAQRLAVLLRDADLSEYQETLEQALFAADVLGYVHEEG